MMTCFHETGTALQSVLLVLSQLTVIVLAGSSILLIRHKYSVNRWKSTTITLLLLLVNIVLFVLMQLDARQELQLQVPGVALGAVTMLSLVFSVWAVLQETRNRKTINNTSVKESFDNLPSGVCFFNESGLPVLCNRAMQRFSFAVCGKDVQFITDLEACLGDDFTPIEGMRKEGKVFVRQDGTAWRLEHRVITYGLGETYHQYTAADVTDLHKSLADLKRGNAQLHQVQTDLKKLSAHVVAITREEEILNAKMRIHDEMGKCLVVAQRYLEEDSVQSIPNSIAHSWQRAVSSLKYNNESVQEDMLLQIRKTCEFVRMDFVQTGELPKQEKTAYLLTCAVRECVTNAVRYAEASTLYASFAETETAATVTVTNNGKVPEGEIREGGGLSTLRRRIEQAGGIMAVQSQPQFKLTVTIPKGMEVGA